MGPQGVEGKVGGKGSRGARGVQGVRGEPGIQGARGPAGSAGADAESGVSFEDFILYHRNAVVAIFGEDYRGNSNFIGSGVRISATEILTAAHVVSGKSSVNASVKGVGLVFGTVQGYDDDRDVALITFRGRAGGETIPLDTNLTWRSAVVGTEIAIIGFVDDISLTTPMICYGRISVRWNHQPGDYSVMNTDACSISGMSGAPVLNSRGDFVGIHLGTRAKKWTSYLSTSEILEVIDDLRKGVKQ